MSIYLFRLLSERTLLQNSLSQSHKDLSHHRQIHLPLPILGQEQLIPDPNIALERQKFRLEREEWQRTLEGERILSANSRKALQVNVFSIENLKKGKQN